MLVVSAETLPDTTQVSATSTQGVNPDARLQNAQVRGTPTCISARIDPTPTARCGPCSETKRPLALAVAFPFSLPIYLFWSLLIVAVEKSGHYLQAAAVTVGAAPVLHCVGALTNRRLFRPAQQWAAGHEVDRATALEATYTFTRRAVPRALWSAAVWYALLFVIVGSSASDLVIVGGAHSRDDPLG
jgi:hypothetical protein